MIKWPVIVIPYVFAAINSVNICHYNGSSPKFFYEGGKLKIYSYLARVGLWLILLKIVGRGRGRGFIERS